MASTTGMFRHNVCRLSSCHFKEIHPRSSIIPRLTRRVFCNRAIRYGLHSSALIVHQHKKRFSSSHSPTSNLPSLPERPPGTPNLLSEEECEFYLPILSSRGWETTSTMVDNTDVAQISVKYVFTKYLYTTRFVNEVIKVVNKERVSVLQFDFFYTLITVYSTTQR